MDKIEWVEIPGFNGRYLINTVGEVKSSLKRFATTGRKPSGAILKQTISRAGYPTVALRKDTRSQRSYGIHRLLAETFIPNPENKPTVNHKNSIRTDYRLENLEWATWSENNSHAFEHGNQVKKLGTDHPGSKLNWQQVDEIRKKYVPRVYTMPMLANEYSIARGSIQGILSGKNWKQ